MVNSSKKNQEKIDWRMRVFDSLSFPTLILKPDRNIISANESFLMKFDISIEHLLGKFCHEIFFNSKEPCSSDICPLSKVLDGKLGQSTLQRRKVEGDKETWEDRVFSPILDDNGEVKYIMESIRDVTRLRSLEKELREAKEFLEKIIYSSPSAIIAADHSGKILLMNHAAEDLFGYSVNAISQKKNIEAVYPPGEARAIMKKLRGQTNGGKGKLPSRKTTIINSNNDEIPVEMTAAIIYDGQKEIATMGIYNDLREKLTVERKLKETQAQLAQSRKDGIHGSVSGRHCP